MPTTKPEAKEKIKKLIERYKQVKRSHQRPTYDEANTRKDFIMPLFQVLGWDIHNDVTEREVVEEADAIKGRVDYSFRINDIPQFLLEAKSLKTKLERPEWAKQSVTYGWNKGIPWVVLTNFEKLKLFNSEWKVAEPKPNLDLSYQNYLEKFDYLWLLSKEAFETNELDKLLGQFGITAKRVNVNEKLAEDLVRWRDILTRNFKQWNDKISVPEVEEAVQRILDRLIFIRVVEDRGIEEKILWQTFQKWEANKRQPNNFLQVLIPIFKDFDKKYNSNLFQTHLCEKLETEGDPFQKIIPELYGDRETGVKYRFDAIGVDVLGSVYEQYLGHVQQREGEESKRKKQGIYYTPTYIVDYIIQNTLGVALKEKTLREAENIKILDPACGSGSFLIKAFAVLDKHLKEEKAQRNAGSEIDFLRRFSILEENIYGVDLDPQAIEIARLNLMLKALVPDHRLPLLTEHMRVGNSLISGTEKELKKYFGKDYQTKKPFNWNEEFEEVFDQGGFDVIIGNPPYLFGENLPGDERQLFSEHYKTARKQYDVYWLLIERSWQLLKEGGLFGFIVPDALLARSEPRVVREFVLNNFAIKKIAHVGEVFDKAGVSAVIIIARKTKGDLNLNKVNIDSVTKLKRTTTRSVCQEDFKKTKEKTFMLYFDEMWEVLFEKLQKNSMPLGRCVNISRGEELGKKNLEKSKQPTKQKVSILAGENVGRYYIHPPNHVVNRSCIKKDVNIYRSPKILVVKTGNRLVGTVDHANHYTLQSLYNLRIKEGCRLHLSYLLCLLNSNLLSQYIIKRVVGYKKLFPQLTQGQILSLPIRKIDFSNKTEEHRHDDLVRLGDKMLKLNQDLQKCAEDSDKYRALQAEIEKVDKQIDQIVYKLYNLTPEEAEIVEES